VGLELAAELIPAPDNGETQQQAGRGQDQRQGGARAIFRLEQLVFESQALGGLELLGQRQPFARQLDLEERHQPQGKARERGQEHEAHRRARRCAPRGLSHSEREC
jgi:hypothetical protein